MTYAYLQSLLESSPEWAKTLEQYAMQNRVPIMEPLSINYLMQLIRIQQPDKILEIGAAIGYSALRMLEARPEASIVTIERDEIRDQEALSNLTAHDAQGKVKLIFGDALECSEMIKNNGPFDFLFIDAAKGQYQRFFELYTPMLSEKGIVISDNVLFKGLVASQYETDGRKQKIANKIRTYNSWLTNHQDFHTTIIPIGDGLAISTKR